MLKHFTAGWNANPKLIRISQHCHLGILRVVFYGTWSAAWTNGLTSGPVGASSIGNMLDQLLHGNLEVGAEAVDGLGRDVSVLHIYHP